MTKILLIDNGIEFDAVSIRKKAIGGAESSFVSLVETLAKLNYEVVVYNNAINKGLINGVSWNKLDDSINNEHFDILIVNRGDKYLNFKTNHKKRYFWIHNPAQYLIKWRYLSKLFFNPATIIFSSHYHLNTYPNWAPAKRRVVIPYGIEEFIIKKREIKKNLPINAIFTSNPLRGLDWLLDRWEKEIFPKVVNAKLHLYTGYKTYGSFGKKHYSKMKPIIERALKLKSMGVKLFNPIKRELLIEKIKNSRVLLYKGSKDETFCMSVAESQTLGIPAIVCNLGCMNERIQNNFTGFVCNDNKEFSDSAIKLLNDDVYWKNFHKNILKKKQYYSWNEIGLKWKDILNESC